jgi:hypothetical protein
MLANERSRRPRVVEMDVREQQVPQVAELDAAPAERLVECGEAARGPAVEERQAVVRLDEVRSDAALVAAVQEVERLVAHAARR